MGGFLPSRASFYPVFAYSSIWQSVTPERRTVHRIVPRQFPAGTWSLQPRELYIVCFYRDTKNQVLRNQKKKYFQLTCACLPAEISPSVGRDATARQETKS